MRALKTGHLGHAYLFSGPAGVGKTTLAVEFAKAILCLDKVGPCGVCRSCQLFDHSNHPDFRRINDEGSSVKIDQIREITREAGYLPVLSPRKVFFLGRLELMTEVAANGFLKTLEEPPASVVFLGVADDENSVLPTIRSRFQGVRLSPVSQEAIAGALIAQGCEPLKAQGLAESSRGLPGVALLSLTQEDEGSWGWASAIEAQDLLALMKKAAETEKMNRQEAEAWLSELEIYYRGRLTKGTQGDLHRVAQALKAIEIARIRLAANVNTRLLFEGLFLQLCS